MDTKQLLTLIIKPTHEYMGGNYQSDSADLLSLCTAAIESDCGHFIKQVGGPALGIWQMESATHFDIWSNCDALERKTRFEDHILKLRIKKSPLNMDKNLILSPMYACTMARLKYAMDENQLPKVTGNRKTDERNFYDYYKRVYNTELGASTFGKWQVKMEKHRVFEVFYKEYGMSELKHKYVQIGYYEIDFNSSHRYLGQKINDFLDGSPDVDGWDDYHTTLRDWDGDFNGIEIYSCDETKELIEWICEKLEISFEDFGHLSFRLIG